MRVLVLHLWLTCGLMRLLVVCPSFTWILMRFTCGGVLLFVWCILVYFGVFAVYLSLTCTFVLFTHGKF